MDEDRTCATCSSNLRCINQAGRAWVQSQLKRPLGRRTIGTDITSHLGPGWGAGAASGGPPGAVAAGLGGSETGLEADGAAARMACARTNGELSP